MFPAWDISSRCRPEEFDDGTHDGVQKQKAPVLVNWGLSLHAEAWRCARHSRLPGTCMPIVFPGHWHDAVQQ